MQTKTALAVAGSVLAVPGTALAAAHDDHSSDRGALHPSGRLTHDAEFKDHLVGGSGDPAAAPEAEQDRRAAMLYSRTGASSWPVCGR